MSGACGVAIRYALLAFVLAPPALCEDTDCARRESGNARFGWLHDLPAIADPPGEAALGAQILLDEVMVNGDDRIYTLIARIDSAAGASALGNIEFTTQPASYAEVLARVRAPDGGVLTLEPGEVTCRVVQVEQGGKLMGKSFAPKHYLFHIPSLEDGALLQYQIAIRYHNAQEIGSMQRMIRREGRFATWTEAYGDQYSQVIPLSVSAQRGLFSLTSDSAQFLRRYPAIETAWIFAVPDSMKLAWRILPAGAPVTVSETPASGSAGGVLKRFSWRRPYRPPEVSAPPENDGPVLVTRVERIDISSRTRPWTPTADWPEWLGKHAYDLLFSIRHDSPALQYVRETLRLPPDAGGFTLADGADRLLRDRVATATGLELKLSATYRPPMELVARSRVATLTEKALTFASLMRTAGTAIRLVLLRPPGLPETPRDWPQAGWLLPNRVIVEVRVGDEVRYYDPASPLPAGALPGAHQGEEALAVADLAGRRRAEWIRLPLSAPGDNRSRLVMSRGGSAEGREQGALTLEFTGTQAERLRRSWRGEARPVEAATAWLAERAEPGCRIGGVVITDQADPDRPLRVDAGYDCALIRRGDRWLTAPLPVAIGPRSYDFPDGARRADLDFRVPERFEWEVVDAGAPPGAPRPPEAWSAGGIAHRIEYPGGDGPATLRGSDEFSGRVPAARYAEFRAALSRATEARRAAVSRAP